MKILRRGIQGGWPITVWVILLQQLLNKADQREGISGTPLHTDGKFGLLTEKALHAFQLRHHLVADKVAGRQTWEALGMSVQIEHNWIRLLGQGYAPTCWSVAASMILGSNQSVPPGPGKLSPEGGPTGIKSIEAFGRSLGWTMLNYSPTVEEIVRIVQRTPVWVAGSNSEIDHAVVLSGAYSDGDPSGDGTLFRIHDSSPGAVGAVYFSFSNPIRIFRRENGYDGLVPVNPYSFLVPR